ncbi:MAG: hemin uptake protein HemP [Alphaproteobacteria bacterium]
MMKSSLNAVEICGIVSPRKGTKRAIAMSRRQIIDLQVNLPQITPLQSDFRRPVRSDIRVFGSDILFDGSTEVGIEHAGSLYRLKITRQGKLILNK